MSNENTPTVIDPKEFGLEKKQSEEITKNLSPILAERDVIMANYAEVIKKDINEETIFEARKIRLLLQKNRTQGITQWHKVNKEFFLRGGQFLDAIKRKEIDVNERAEDQLMEIEKHYEKQEEARRAKLKEDRLKALEPYEVDTEFYNLEEMPDESFDQLLENSKLAFEAKKEQERKEEEERIEKERIAALNTERKEKLLPYWQFASKEYNYHNLGKLSDKEFDDLLNKAKADKEADDKERERVAKENERLQKEAEQKEAKAKKEREAAEAKAEKDRKAAEDKLKKEREAKEKAEAELQAKEAEAKRIADEQKEAEKQARLAPDKDKLNNLITTIQAIELPSVKSAEVKTVIDDAETLLKKTCDHLRSKMDTL